jgi:hypothetical protein
MTGNQIHELKTWPNYFAAIARGTKKFEVRENDRGFSVGDQLRLKEYNPDTNEYTGAELYCSVDYVLKGGRFGLKSTYCIMSITLLPTE